MAFDFAARPPEVNSTLMYSGAGAGPLTAAAATFGTLSSELSTNAAAYESIISQLTGSEWTGPSATAAATAAQQNIDWLNTTSVQLQEAAAKATASAAAYEAAFSATIPPPVVYANRAQLAALVATNILGQNTPAIAANEALYGEFWAQDATALTTYAANAAAAAQVTPLTEPTQSTNPGGTGAQAAAVSSAVNSNASNSSLNGLLGSLQSTVECGCHPGGQYGGHSARRSCTARSRASSAFGSCATRSTPSTSPARGSCSSVCRPSRCWRTSLPALRSVHHERCHPLGAGLGFGTTLAGATSGVGSGRRWPAWARASEVGGMSVPAGWSAAAPAAAAAEATLAGSGWTAAADEAATGMGGGGMNGVMPGMASAGGKSGMGIGGPRYGVKPKVMPKQVFV